MENIEWRSKRGIAFGCAPAVITSQTDVLPAKGHDMGEEIIGSGGAVGVQLSDGAAFIIGCDPLRSK